MNRHAIYALTLSMLIGIGATSCTKYNEVDPPRTDQKSTDELPLPSHTISQLKALYKRGGTLIDKPIVISAVIASDDSEGNLYKSCYIEDETGGMELKFALGNLSSVYPRVREYASSVRACSSATTLDRSISDMPPRMRSTRRPSTLSSSYTASSSRKVTPISSPTSSPSRR